MQLILLKNSLEKYRFCNKMNFKMKYIDSSIILLIILTLSQLTTSTLIDPVINKFTNIVQYFYLKLLADDCDVHRW
jgi:hypothetical protein